ncbi:MAG: hypothetical protein AAF389_01690 [Gemmatimonadota bacterium]
MTTRALFGPGVVLCLALFVAPAASQVGVSTDPTSSVRTRSELEALLVEYDQVLASPAYSDAVKRQTRIAADRVRERLTMGDFMLGDAIVLSVDQEPNLPDTVQVRSSPQGPIISLPMFGDIPLTGVLRSEIEPHLTAELGKIIINPRVRAEGLIRISVQGAVGNPGPIWVTADMLVDQALVVAGGPSTSAATNDLRILRGTQVIFEGEPLQELIRQGRTLDQLNLQAGDQFLMPEQGDGILGNLGVVLGLATSLTTVLILFLR